MSPMQILAPAGRRRLALGGLVLASALTLVGCGHETPSPSVASLGASGSAGASPSATATGKASPLAYSRCMRSHGVKDFPDPTSGGDVQLNAGPGSDLDPNNPTFKAADAACKALRPTGGKPPAGLNAASLKYAKCMRGHGISDFPDPKADGTLQLQSKPGGDLDPANPRFKAANDICKQNLPDQGEGGTLHSENS